MVYCDCMLTHIRIVDLFIIVPTILYSSREWIAQFSCLNTMVAVSFAEHTTILISIENESWIETWYGKMCRIESYADEGGNFDLEGNILFFNEIFIVSLFLYIFMVLLNCLLARTDIFMVNNLFNFSNTPTKLIWNHSLIWKKTHYNV